MIFVLFVIVLAAGVLLMLYNVCRFRVGIPRGNSLPSSARGPLPSVPGT